MKAAPYAPMDPKNRVPSYAAARCAICGAYNDLTRAGSSFRCRGLCYRERSTLFYSDKLRAMQGGSEPA